MVHEDVLEFDIPMDNSLPVDVGEGVHELVENKVGLILGETLLGESFEELVERNRVLVLHDETDMVVRLNHGVKLDDIRVAQLAQYFDFSLDVLLPLLVDELGLIVALDGDGGGGGPVEGEADDRVGPESKSFLEAEILEDLGALDAVDDGVSLPGGEQDLSGRVFRFGEGQLLRRGGESVGGGERVLRGLGAHDTFDLVLEIFFQLNRDILVGG